MSTALPDCPKFREMWERGDTQVAIAAHFGVKQGTVSNRAKAYGYAPRQVYTTRRSEPRPRRFVVAADAPAPAPANVPPLPEAKAQALAAGRWDTAQVVAVFRTQGRYAELSALAARWGVSVTSLVGLWHRVRVAT